MVKSGDIGQIVSNKKKILNTAAMERLKMFGLKEVKFMRLQ